MCECSQDKAAVTNLSTPDTLVHERSQGWAQRLQHQVALMSSLISWSFCIQVHNVRMAAAVQEVALLIDVESIALLQHSSWEKRVDGSKN